MKDWMDTSFEITNLSRFLQNENISTEFVNKTIDGQFTQKVCRILLHFAKSQTAHVIGAYQNMENLAGKIRVIEIKKQINSFDFFNGKY